jgi:nucleotide-binding universal stress UspA family protein
MFRQILVPLDGSLFAEGSVPLAAEIARRANATLHMVLVHRSLGFESSGDMSAIHLREIDSQVLAQEQSYLARCAARAHATTGVRTTKALLVGDVVPAIQEYVSANQIQIVIMTTHGRGGFRRAWLGSVTDAMVRCLPVPVLVLRSKEKEGEPASEPRLDRVLAATDGSLAAANAFRAALTLCRVTGASCTIVRVVTPPMPVYPPFVPEPITFPSTDLEQRHAIASRSMDDSVELARRACVPLTTRVLVEARPAEAILRCAAEEDADLIVLGTHGHSRLARWVLGSVADKVIRGATIPVMVCPEDLTFFGIDTTPQAEELEDVEIC